MIVMKFGGSSVENAERIRRVAAIIRSMREKKPVVVVSGLGGVTDDLIEAAGSSAKSGKTGAEVERIIRRHLEAVEKLGLGREVVESEIRQLRKLSDEIAWAGRLTPKNLDKMMSFGERLSARIIAGYLRLEGLSAVAYDAYDIGMLTDSNFGDADVLQEAYQKIRNSIRNVRGVPIITGFVGKDEKGNITTLGRGGSDYTATIIGTAIGASEIQIWTNVNGIMTADPAVVREARNIRNISYEEEAELEFLGATKLNPKGILPAMERKIMVRILNTLSPEQNGTVITDEIKAKRRVASITQRENVKMIDVCKRRMFADKKFVRKTLEILERHGLPVDLISPSRTKVAIVISRVSESGVARLVEDLEMTGKVSVREGMSRVSVVGKSVSGMPMISARILGALGKIPIEAVIVGGSHLSQSVVMDSKYAEKAVRLLHEEFFG